MAGKWELPNGYKHLKGGHGVLKRVYYLVVILFVLFAVDACSKVYLPTVLDTGTRVVLELLVVLLLLYRSAGRVDTISFDRGACCYTAVTLLYRCGFLIAYMCLRCSPQHYLYLRTVRHRSVTRAKATGCIRMSSTP